MSTVTNDVVLFATTTIRRGEIVSVDGRRELYVRRSRKGDIMLGIAMDTIRAGQRGRIRPLGRPIVQRVHQWVRSGHLFGRRKRLLAICCGHRGDYVMAIELFTPERRR